MGLWSAAKALYHGDVQDSFSYLFVPEEEVSRGNQLDSALLKDVADHEARGLVTAEQAAITASRIEQNAFPYYVDGRKRGALFQQEGTNPALGFAQGLEEGIVNIRNTIGTALGIPFRLIPWQAYAILGVIIFIWAWPWIGPFIMGARARAGIRR